MGTENLELAEAAAECSALFRACVKPMPPTDIRARAMEVCDLVDRLVAERIELDAESAKAMDLT